MQTMEQPLEDQVAESARIYLGMGPAPLSELTRVIAQHLESPAPAVRAAVLALGRSGVLHLTNHTVSLPAGAETRDTKE